MPPCRFQEVWYRGLDRDPRTDEINVNDCLERIY